MRDGSHVARQLLVAYVANTFPRDLPLVVTGNSTHRRIRPGRKNKQAAGF